MILVVAIKTVRSLKVMLGFDETRRALGEEVSTRGVVTDRVWDYLVREGHVTAVQNGSRDVAWLAERVKSFLVTTGRWTEARDRKEPMLSESTRIGDSMLVLSRIMAKEATERREVKYFRDHVLGGSLLKANEVEPWIKEREHKPARPGHGMYLTIEGPESGIEHTGLFKLKTPITVHETLGGGWRTLAYAVPGDEWIRHVTTHVSKGELAQLRYISEDLAKTYHWQEAQATVFVLTGQTPMIPSFRYSVLNKWPGGPRRITLNIDLILSPKELAARYTEIRRKLRPEKARHREPGEKHLRLALFVTGRGDDEPWAARFKAWNSKYPNWKYSAQSNFRRDAGRAVERIVAPITSAHDAMGALFGKREPGDDGAAPGTPGMVPEA